MTIAPVRPPVDDDEKKTPKVVQNILDFKRDVYVHEQDTMRYLLEQWTQSQSNLQGLINKVADQIGLKMKRGEPILSSELSRLDRYRDLLSQIRVEVYRYNLMVERQIEMNQSRMQDLALLHTGDVLAEMTKGSRVSGNFNLMSKNAVETMMAQTRKGAPLGDLLAKSFPETVLALTAKLTDATLRGLNPKETAREMSKTLMVPVNRALLISRTSHSPLIEKPVE